LSPQLELSDRRLTGAELGEEFGLRARGIGAFFDALVAMMILHDWNLERKKHLIRAAYDALPSNGGLTTVEALIDDARRENAFGLLMSLNMLIEFGDASDYSGADFQEWCREAGFKRFEVIQLAGPSSAAIAYK
jgi:O-methyltransferase domain